MKNIAFLSHDGYIGGAEKMIIEAARALKKSKKYNPIIFFPYTTDNKWIPQLESDSIDYVITSEIPLYCWNNKISCDEKKINEFKGLFSIYNIQILVSNTMTNYVGILAAISNSIPVILWCHGVLDASMITYDDFDADLNLLRDRILIALSDKVLFCSKWVKDYYNDYCESKGQVLYNWTDSGKDMSQITESSSREFVCLNTIEPNKGIMLCLQAIKKVHDKRNDFHFTFYGKNETEYQKNLYEYVSTNQLEDVVSFKEKTADIGKIYEDAFCLIQPSYNEPFGLTIIEAMSYGRPVIATKSGGPQEILDDKSGILVDIGDSDAIAVAVEKLLDSPEVAKQMGISGHELYRSNFSSSGICERLELIITEVIRDYRSNDLLRKLIYDDLMHQIREYCGFINLPIKEKCTELIGKKIDSAKLRLSKQIKFNKTYWIACDKNSINGIGMIFTSFQEFEDYGNVRIRLKYNSRIIREATLSNSEIENNKWCVFSFNKLSETAGKVFEIEIIFSYTTSKLYGVYEFMPRVSNLYKCKEKLGVSSKEIDVLFYELI